MLTRLLATFASAAALALGLSVPAVAADNPVAPPPTCPSGQVWMGGTCVLFVTGNDLGQSGTRGAGAGAPRVCTLDGATIPCTTSLGAWHSSRQCYVAPLATTPPFSDPRWEGHTDGVIYSCADANNRLNLYTFWAATPPVRIDAEDLARQVRSTMQFTPVRIGIVPEPGPDSMGLVGLPTWLWVQNPGATTLGPQTRSLSSGGVTVTLTAKVKSTRWEMGDGGVVTCTTSGTPYEERFGMSPSPTCGYQYMRQGNFTVNALTNWEAMWRASTGEQGVFTWQVGSSTSISMGEAQVINR